MLSNTSNDLAYRIQTISTGEILVNCEGGFMYFHPDSLRHNPYPPPVVVTSFKVFDQEIKLDRGINYTDQINLSYQQNFFSFSFAALNYTVPKKNQYAYKLEGFEEEWVYCGARTYASYTNLDGGYYTFRVKAANNDGVWNEEGTSIKIYIAPPFWQTWWFQLLSIVLILASLYSIYRIRVNVIQNREQLKSAFEKKLAEIEMKALRAQMNPHFLFNCLNSIKHYIVKNDPELASDYLTKFSRLIRLILQNSKSSTIVLADELESLKLYIEMESMRFDNKFDYEIVVDKTIDPEIVAIPPMILQPYIENAIWHGLMHLPPHESNKDTKGHLLINIYKEDASLICIIEDNGIGRKKAMELKSKSATRNKSMGMQITTDRIAITKKLYGIDTSVEIIDLKDKLGNASGTAVRLNIPVLESEVLT